MISYVLFQFLEFSGGLEGGSGLPAFQHAVRTRKRGRKNSSLVSIVLPMTKDQAIFLSST